MLYNEEIDEHCRKLREASDAFLASCGKNKQEIYRIENFTPTPVPEAHYGEFFDGDSYVCIMKGEKTYDIHYWEGVDSSADETGCAAAFTTQLSDILPMPARHHLELMGEESDLFLSHFKNGIKIMHGGVDSGFKHVPPVEHKPELMRVVGGKYPRIFPVPLTAKSLCENDCFVLDLGDNIYNWYGSACTSLEKMAALNYSVDLKNHMRLTHAKLHYPQTMGGQIEVDFWAALGGTKEDVQPVKPEEEVNLDEDELLRYKLWHVYEDTNDEGKIKGEEIHERPLRRKMLKEDDTFILELYDKVYVWQGKKASTKEKHMSMTIANKYKKEWNKPKGTSITRVPQGVEDSLFMSYFEGFYKGDAEDMGLGKEGLDLKTKKAQDISKIANQHLEAAKLMMDKLGSNYELNIYHLQDNLTNAVLIDKHEHGYFFNEESYILDFKGAEHRYMITWKGPVFVNQEHAVCSETMNKLEGNELSSNTTRTEVQSCQEPEDLMQFFPNGLIILNGPRRPLPEVNATIKEGGALFRIQAPYGHGARAIQQESCKSELLNGYQVYVMIHGENGWLWRGEHSQEAEVKLGKMIFDHYNCQNKVEFDEGQETDEFWELLGGKAAYNTIHDSMLMSGDFEPMLFEISNRSGYMWMKQVPSFSQQSLHNNDVYLLDAWNHFYLWIGNESNKFERNAGYKRGAAYIEALKDGRDKDKIQIIEIKPTQEPAMFKVQFPNWSDHYSEHWLTKDLLEKMQNQHGSGGNVASAQKLEGAPQQEEAKDAAKDMFAGYNDPVVNVMSYADLKGIFPPGVKPDKKEQYLSNEEFESLFKMSKEEFNKLKLWKQQDLKKKHGLF